MNIVSYHEVFDKITCHLVKDKILSALFLDCSEFGTFETWYGKKTYLNIMNIVKKTISDMKGTYIRENDIITTNHPSDEQFFIFLSHKRKDKDFTTTGLEELAERVNHYLNREISEGALKMMQDKPGIYVGHAVVIYSSFVSIEKLLSRLMEDSKKMAEYQKFRSVTRHKEKVQELIYREKISTVYQPIININTLEILGYEALTRGPKNSEYENPYQLFKAAREVGLVLELDRICTKHAFINARKSPANTKLFINCLPSSLNVQEFKEMDITTLLKESRISPTNIVLEITEREAIENYSNFKKVLSHYIEHGIAIAIDDTGAGYSSFEALVELKPDYIKIDISMIRDINENTLKQEMIKALVNISKDIKAVIIGEGIETEQEYNTLKQLGVTHGQGYLFARPAFPFPPLNPPYGPKK